MNYYFLPVSLVLFIIIILTQKSRRLWNIVLLISFLISGVLGLLMSTGLHLPFYSFFLWLHVEAGIIMAIVSLFHAFWHLPYYFPRRLN
ncbi:MAG TPA: hypothetical protein PK639_04080 [Candidatus Woesebacteria bacterium]|nr:hypothetical protein [Candidatus Woesebacteria bacterium]